MKTPKKLQLAAAAFATFAFAAAPLSAAHLSIYTSQINPLNVDYDEDGMAPNGYAVVVVNTEDADEDLMGGMATVRVVMHVEGLEDLSMIDGAAHVSHIHGAFLTQSGNNSGEGGLPGTSVTPSTFEDDANRDGFLSLFEGLPDYGPVLLNLAGAQVPAADEGTGQLLAGLNFLAENELTPADAFPNGKVFDLDMTYEFDLSDSNARRVFNNLMPLNAREIVVHGATVPTEISDTVDETTMELGLPDALLGVEVEDGESYRITAPVAAGTLEAAPNINLDSMTGWRMAGELGWVNAGFYPWIYSPSLGLQYVGDFEIEGSWIYDTEFGWYYTPAEIDDPIN